ncbi:MAG: DUF6152 family protein, partial [Acidobacteriota bacterium]|nr:DUF6152 family protein [Acidobacteriota bacterium]
EMDVPDGNGGSAIWNVEMPSPVVLIRAGWKPSVIKPGDKVTVVAHPQQSGEPGGLFISLTLPDGRTLTDKPPATDASRGNLPRAVLTMPSSELWVWIQQDRRARYLERRSLLDELGLSFRT